MSKKYIQEKLQGDYGQVVSFDQNLNAIIKNAPVYSARSITLVVHAPDKESRVVVTNGEFTYESNPSYSELVPSQSEGLVTSSDDSFYVEEGDTRVFYLPLLGTWVVTAVKGGIQAQTSVYIGSTGSYEVSLSYFKAYIDVTYPVGAICTCTNGTVTLTAPDTDGSYRFCVSNLGDWVVQAIAETGSGQAVQIVNISSAEELVEITISYINSVLNNNSWQIIQDITLKGLASSYWSIGDVKTLSLNGTVGARTFSNYALQVELIGFDHNTSIESNSKSTVTFQIGKQSSRRIGLYNSSGFYMNSSSTNVGGWELSYMRKTLLPALLNALPADLVNYIIPVKKYTDNAGNSSSALANVTFTYDDLFLLSEYEVTGTATNSNSNENSYQQQYTYYVNNSAASSRIRYRDNTSTANAWWLRSPYKSNSSYYCCINTSGTLATSTASTGSYMISPAFVIGG